MTRPEDPGRGDGAPHVHGPVVDGQTRCVHYAGPLDVVAIRMHCCDRYYPCHRCHAESEDHPLIPVPAARADRPGALCGVCRAQLTVTAYRAAESCPACGAGFNPGCRLHDRIYFAGEA